MRGLVLALMLLAFGCGQKGAVLDAPQNVTASIYTSPNEGIRYLLIRDKDGPKPVAILLFPGGDGTCHFGYSSEKDGCGKDSGNSIDLGRELWVSYNFLARNAQAFAGRKHVVILLDMPPQVKNRFNGFNNKAVASAYRVGSDWDGDGSPEPEDVLRDVEDVLRDAQNKTGLSFSEVYLLGVSRGSLASGYLSHRLSGVSGVVLTASVVSDDFSYCTSGSDFIDCTGLNSYDGRLLMVHHRDDGCRVSSYTYAQNTFSNLTTSQKKFVTVTGGSEVSSSPCKGKTYHGFYGKDSEVVNLILDWIEGKEIPSDI